MEKIYGIIDIGTNKVSTLICSAERNNITVLGKGTDICKGVTRGMITDPSSVTLSMSSTISQAESMAGATIRSAYVNLKPLHIEVINRRNWCNISADDRKVNIEDIKNVNEQVRNIEINDDWQLIDVIPRYYIVDNNEGIFDPAGMVGSRLGIDAYVICGYKNYINSILRCLSNTDIELDGFIIEPLAIKESVLDINENEKGVVVINVGSTLTDTAVFSGDKLVFCKTLPVGGENILKDLSIALEIPFSEAESIKKQCNLALKSLIQEDREFLVTDINSGDKKKIYKSWAVEIIEARINEIFTLSRDMILNEDAEMFGVSEVLLTGSGIGEIFGCIEMANNVFNTPVRYISAEDTDNPEYTGCMHMARFLAKCPGDLWPSSNIEFFNSVLDSEKKGFVDKVISFLERFL